MLSRREAAQARQLRTLLQRLDEHLRTLKVELDQPHHAVRWGRSENLVIASGIAKMEWDFEGSPGSLHSRVARSVVQVIRIMRGKSNEKLTALAALRP